MPTAPKTTAKQAENALRKKALSYPESAESFPWGERAIKVKGKTFLFMRCETGMLSLSVKLSDSNEAALKLPFATSTGYGLGKSGWVTAKFEKGDAIPLERLLKWLDESFRNVAPKKLLSTLR